MPQRLRVMLDRKTCIEVQAFLLERLGDLAEAPPESEATRLRKARLKRGIRALEESLGGFPTPMQVLDNPERPRSEHAGI